MNRYSPEKKLEVCVESRSSCDSVVASWRNGSASDSRSEGCVFKSHPLFGACEEEGSHGKGPAITRTGDEKREKKGEEKEDERGARPFRSLSAFRQPIGARLSPNGGRSPALLKGPPPPLTCPEPFRPVPGPSVGMDRPPETGLPPDRSDGPSSRREVGRSFDGGPGLGEEEGDGEDVVARGNRPFRLQDSRSLDGLSGAAGVGPEAGGAAGGRRATISSALELEGTVSRHGHLTHFVANNLQLKIRLSAAAAAATPPQPPPPPPRIPPIDPEVLRDLERLSREVGGRVDRLLGGLGGAVQELTALSVGCIQTYRDAVDSLGEAVDMSIKGMYTLLARCEELDRALQPVHALARQVRDIRRTLEVLEGLCK
ncbi:BLOC-1-related complex subunit 6 [Tachyglossus aculeatus]|uniref:BLOC-1-related complex subunit 6 n=1 Tax=Tachyglossus aculeatus TaxID=9261 RepID=UPI0018F4A2B2|nr:BLOC-1-related complex subunit 6 [Tachyglossus aculeatus]